VLIIKRCLHALFRGPHAPQYSITLLIGVASGLVAQTLRSSEHSKIGSGRMLNHAVKKKLDLTAQTYCFNGTKNSGVEYLYAYDMASGICLGKAQGTKNSVSIPLAVAQAGQDPSRSIKVTHSHPGSTSFSTVDLLTLFANPGFAELEVVGADMSEFWCRVSAAPGSRELAKEYITRSYAAFLRASQPFGRPLTSSEITFIDFESAHVICTVLALLGVLNYRCNMATGRRIDNTVTYASLVNAFVNGVYVQIVNAGW
jgi:hypothetical protein